MNPKPGKQASEFWLSVGFMALAAANGTVYVNIPWDQFPFIAAVVGLYSGGRSFVKGRTIKGLVAEAVAAAKSEGKGK